MMSPEGFEPFQSSPFFDGIGPVWICRDAMPPIFGLTIEERHTNINGTAHGALLVGLGDLALGHGIRAVARRNGRELQIVSAGLTVDFARAVTKGAWVEAQADIQRQTKRTVFASCYLESGGHRAVRVSGIYTILGD